MDQGLLAFLGITSATVNTIGLLPYLRDIIRRKTKPDRATWWIWFTLNLIAFFAQVAAGATWSLGLTIAQMLAVGLIAFFSLRYGFGAFHRRHYVSLAVAAVGIILWQLTADPLIALIIVVLVDFLALWLTITKTWHAPETETLSAWVFAAVAGGLGFLAVGDFTNLTTVLYPLYIFVANTFIVWEISHRRKVLSKPARTV